MIDSFHPALRHLVLMLLATALSWVGTDLIPWLDTNDVWGPLLAALVTALVTYVTPLTRQYGLFKRVDGAHEA